MKKFVSFIAIACFSIGLSIAQESNAEAVSKLKSHIKAMYESYLSGPSSIPSEEEFAALFDKSFSGSEVQVDVRGAVSRELTDLGTMLKDYHSYKTSNDYRVSFRIKEFHKVAVIGKTGVAAMDIAFEIYKQDNLISKGDQTVSMTLKMVEDTWKVTFINRLFVESEKHMGNCICDILSSGTTGLENAGNFATYLTVPHGDEYIEVNDRFVIKGSGKKRIIVRNREDSYDWDLTSGEIVKNGEVIGNAKTSSTAIRNILKFVNVERCQRVSLNK